MAAVLSNVVILPQDASPTTGTLVLSGSIVNPTSDGGIPSDGTGVVSLTVTAIDIPDGTVVSLSATFNDETLGTASGLPSVSFPALSGGTASLSYTVPAVPSGTGSSDVLTVTFQASTSGSSSSGNGLSAAENVAAIATTKAEMANRPSSGHPATPSVTIPTSRPVTAAERAKGATFVDAAGVPRRPNGSRVA